MELQVIQNKIYEIRGQKVMLDFDLAEMYQIETGRLNEAVKRNTKRFPKDFMFQLTAYEWDSLISQIAISNESRGGRRFTPYAFTELGVTMLSSILRSDIAIQASIQIVRAFVAMRHLVINSPIYEVRVLQNEVLRLKQYIEESFADYNDINEDTRIQLELINQSLAELQANKKTDEQPRKQIGFVIGENKNTEK